MSASRPHRDRGHPAGGWRLRAATPGDAAALAVLEPELFGGDAWSASLIGDELASEHTVYVVAELGPEDARDIIGYAGVMAPRGSSEADVQTIATVPGARRGGVATAMLRELARAAVERGARALFLEVRVDNAAAIALYERHGFTPLGERPGYYERGTVSALVMRASLPLADPAYSPRAQATPQEDRA